MPVKLLFSITILLSSPSWAMQDLAEHSVSVLEPQAPDRNTFVLHPLGILEVNPVIYLFHPFDESTSVTLTLREEDHDKDPAFSGPNFITNVQNLNFRALKINGELVPLPDQAGITVEQNERKGALTLEELANQLSEFDLKQPENLCNAVTALFLLKTITGFKQEVMVSLMEQIPEPHFKRIALTMILQRMDTAALSARPHYFEAYGLSEAQIKATKNEVSMQILREKDRESRQRAKEVWQQLESQRAATEALLKRSLQQTAEECERIRRQADKEYERIERQSDVPSRLLEKEIERIGQQADKEFERIRRQFHTPEAKSQEIDAPLEEAEKDENPSALFDRFSKANFHTAMDSSKNSALPRFLAGEATVPSIESIVYFLKQYSMDGGRAKAVGIFSTYLQQKGVKTDSAHGISEMLKTFSMDSGRMKALKHLRPICPDAPSLEFIEKISNAFCLSISARSRIKKMFQTP